MKDIALAFLFVTLLAPATFGGVSLGAQCEGNTVQVGVHVFNYDFPEDWIGLVVQRGLVGSCGTEQIITDEPLPIPDHMQEATYSFSDPVPAQNVYYGYRALAIDNQGKLHPVPGEGDPLPYDFATCGEAVAARGYLVYMYGSIPALEPCPDLCWNLCILDLIDFSALDPDEYEPYINLPVPVDIYGEAWVDGMPGSPCLYATRLEPTPGGNCRPMPNRRSSWSAVKARYR